MKKGNNYIYVVIGVITAVLLYVVWLSWTKYAEYASTLPEPGSFGDQFGGLNALFTGWAFVLLIVTLIVQMIELRFQRLEIEGQKVALERQNTTLQFQQFEERFFNMLRISHEIKSNVKIGDAEGIVGFALLSYEIGILYKLFFSGSTEFDNNERSVMIKYGITMLDVRDHASDNDMEIIKIAYKHLFDLNHYEIGHYFRNIFNTLKLVKARRQVAFDNLKSNQLDKTEVDREKVKITSKYKDYANMIQAQMSSAELTLMFYNGLFFPKMKDLINDFQLIDNLPVEDLILEQHKNYYELEFKSRNDIFG